MKKLLFTIILFFNSVLMVNATSISNIDMDIYVDNNGVATIKETWNASVSEGTEGWHPYYNIGSSEIYDVKASMDGKSFDTIDDWIESASFSDKAYKAGIYYPQSNEVDIVFGVSEYGSHVYSIEYKISNFVSTTSDADIIYWNLFPYDFSAEPENVSIKIYSDFRYEDNLPVWGYGKYGAPCYVYDGRIEMTSDGIINSSEYLTILVKFPKGTFNTSSVLDNDFEHYHDMAEDGATNYNDKKNFWDKLIDFIIPFISIFFNVIVWGIIFVVAMFSTKKKNNLKFGSAGNKVKKDVLPFREIPCNKDIYRAYWVADSYNLNKKKEDFLGSVLLRWLQNGNVRIEKVTSKGLFKEKINDNVIFEKRPDDSIELECRLYDYMFQASGDGKLESGEFKKWCSSHYSKILKWFDDVLDFEVKMLVNENKATEEVSGKLFKTTYYKIDDIMMNDAEEMAGLKKFLKEFTLIKEREPIEVKLWNEYLMYASIFGIADEVASQFRKLYPEVITEMDNRGYNYNDIVFIHSITSDGIKSANTAKSRAESYSSGGGGFSSGGGGGGSFGGGGGGGGFR
ncbi:MAG: DUF2207 domain-containing protein [Bacilli bacterium]|nr:DUF2207 domain-containing protein [Bacilli bacterium]